jgi:RNA-directed DNA polymerase
MSSTRGGRGEMTKTPITLQDLRRRLYVKAKTEPSWRFWGLYGHVCKRETLRAAYELAKQNDGAPGVDGVTFEAIEAESVDAFLTGFARSSCSGAIDPYDRGQSEYRKRGARFATSPFRQFAIAWYRVR